MRIGMAQMNAHLGNFESNIEQMVAMANEAQEKRCDLVVFPELSLLGYHPFDLLERPTIIDEQNRLLNSLLDKLPKDIFILIGAVSFNKGKGKPYFNSALLVHSGKVVETFNKELLPVYDVFDDSRHFSPGQLKDNIFEIKGKKIQLLICEDMWGWDPLHEHNPIESLAKNSVDFIVNMSASPFTLEKQQQRLEYAKKTVNHLGAPLVYVNMVGAQDELIFDGGSFATDASGNLLAQSADFLEDFNLVDFGDARGGIRPITTDETAKLHKALTLGIRDFVKKIGFQKVHIGLSGGIDSAVVACLVADAIGPENLTCIALPTRFNSQESYNVAKKLAENLHCSFHELSIQPAFEQMVESYEACFGDKKFSLMHENLQSRLRGDFLMAYSNETGSLLITTGNKSEYATGYATLYGDMCGGLAPIADLLKEQVYDLAKYYNRELELIPDFIITRPPSAELRENQKDSDSLPDYDVLDDSVNRLVCGKGQAKSEVDSWVLQRLFLSEFKRWQAPPILKVSDHAFGQGRRMPIAHKAKN